MFFLRPHILCKWLHSPGWTGAQAKLKMERRGAQLVSVSCRSPCWPATSLCKTGECRPEIISRISIPICLCSKLSSQISVLGLLYEKPHFLCRLTVNLECSHFTDFSRVLFGRSVSGWGTMKCWAHHIPHIWRQGCVWKDDYVCGSRARSFSTANTKIRHGTRS
jgi:hypothetical protein